MNLQHLCMYFDSMTVQRSLISFSILLVTLTLNGSVFGQSMMFSSIDESDHHNFNLLTLKDSNSTSDYKRATIMSAIIPGLGQIYNEKYWKVGIIYTAGFIMGYGMKYNVDSLRQYQKALNARVDTSSATVDNWYPQLTDAKVTGERDYYRRNRDMLILGFIGVYALQIIDANVDAHLKEFEINDDLSFKISPDIQMGINNQIRTGLSFRLRF